MLPARIVERIPDGSLCHSPIRRPTDGFARSSACSWRGVSENRTVSADENHNKHPGEITWDSFGAWTCIKADKLDYKSITDAMANGNYYASQGPDFSEISYEDGKVTVKTSPIATIAFSTGSRHAGYFGNADGTPITEATFELKETDNYFRITIRDEHGKPAHSRAYFLDELK